MGHHPFPLPIGVKLGNEDPFHQAPLNIGLSDGFPDPTESKRDAHVCTMKPALRHENVTFLVKSLENLYVVDSSFFVSSTAVHPGLTIMANALRAGDHIKER